MISWFVQENQKFRIKQLSLLNFNIAKHLFKKGWNTVKSELQKIFSFLI